MTADLKLALFSWTKSAKKCVTTGFLPQALLISEWTDTKTDNWGNPTLPEHCLPAGTEIRHYFLVHEDLLQWSSLRTSRKRHFLIQIIVVYSALVSVEDEIDAVMKKLYKHSCLYSILHTISVYNIEDNTIFNKQYQRKVLNL